MPVRVDLVRERECVCVCARAHKRARMCVLVKDLKFLKTRRIQPHILNDIKWRVPLYHHFV